MSMPVEIVPIPEDSELNTGAVLATARHFRFGAFEFHSSPAHLAQGSETDSGPASRDFVRPFAGAEATTKQQADPGDGQSRL